MNIYNSTSFCVGYDQGHLLLKCSKRLQTDDFKEGLKRALFYAGKNNVKCWLLDVRAIGCLNEEEETWLQTHLYPQIMATLGINNFVAVVLSEKCYSSLLLEAGSYGLKSYNSFIIMNTFYTPEAGLNWLEEAVCVAAVG